MATVARLWKRATTSVARITRGTHIDTLPSNLHLFFAIDPTLSRFPVPLQHLGA
jgi:hypothetical protein